MIVALLKVSYSEALGTTLGRNVRNVRNVEGFVTLSKKDPSVLTVEMNMPF